MKKTLFAAQIAVLAFIGLGAAQPTFAADYPDRPIEIVVPWAAGGATD